MLSPDKGTRNLLPAFAEEPPEMVLTGSEHEGEVRPIPGAPMPAPQTYIPAADQAPLPAETLQQGDVGVQQPNSPSTGQGANETLSSNVLDSAGIDRESVYARDTNYASAHVGGSGGGSGGASSTAGVSPTLSPSSSGTTSIPILDRDDGHVLTPAASGDSISDPSPGGGITQEIPSSSISPAPGSIPLVVPDGDSINVVQVAFVDQDAEVLLNGWIGESKIRVFVDNDTDMAQDANVDLDLDGNGQLMLRLNQSMTINQETEIDLDIYEIKGILYVDLYVRNEVDIEQDTELDLMMGGWTGPSWIVANNDLDVRQTTDVDVDIADDLEEKFSIKVAIALKQLIDVDQDADVDVTYADGAFGIDVDAVQTANIDQDTTLKIDFSVI
ncbi:hypothetical protein MHY87_18570 [Microvirga sp. ACRRW]|uniref:hypothetical protein n=1 Tax=Microvirga sp. ACRRW TaxID=2918205 RepID=UPI001EF54EE8|nr:hypothetical protein [Microvirga sp. ACRRW]MCG7394906.1 hypothetical protein [Microvirga sp. ACRRW]